MKFHFSYLWLLFFALSLFSHALKTYLIIFAMLFVHEMAHVQTALYLGYRVAEIHVYPFGFSAVIHHLDHGKTWEILLILLAGLSMHLLFPTALELFYRLNLISSAYRDYLIHINFAILFFNLLPLYPMDGGRILLCLLRLFVSYRLARKIMIILSLMLCSLLFYIGVWNMKIMVVFIIFLLVMEIKKSPLDLVEFNYYQRNRFKLHKNHV